jgi:RNA ligase (TIGR02306 family)
MSTFAVNARRITLSPIENADRLELAHIDGTEYVSVVQKGLHSDGDLIVYIPEAAILPDPLIEEMGLVADDGKTMLAGGTLSPDGSKKRNRVKALRLRGTLSQGLVYKPRVGHYADLMVGLDEGVDYGEVMGIVKYVPPVPTNLSGKVEHVPGLRSYTDIENIKNFPDVLTTGEEVVAHEKAHGTCSIMTRLVDGELAVSSKGLASRQMAIVNELDNHDAPVNAYHRMAARYDVQAKLDVLATRYPGSVITLFGETLGVQDLMYGLQKGELSFRAFDIRVDDRFLDHDEFAAACVLLDLPQVPLLYRGPFDRVKIDEVTTGRETISGKETHVREGVVVRPVIERRDDELGRVIVKSISPKYLLRKGDATEFE